MRSRSSSNARAVVIDMNQQHAVAATLGGDAQAPGRPFAGIVQQIARHLLQVLLITAKRQIRRKGRHIDIQPALRMQTAHDAQQRLQRRPQRRAPLDRAGRRRARARAR